MLHSQLRHLISQWIETERKRRGIGVETLALAAGISRGNLSRIINERQGTDDDLIRKIADALGAPVPELTLTGRSARSPVEVLRDAAGDVSKAADELAAALARAAEMEALRAAEDRARYEAGQPSEHQHPPQDKSA